MKKQFIFIFIIMVTPWLCEAEEKEDYDNAPIFMEEIVITATRDSENVQKVPANVSVITSEQIKNSGATTIVELLQKKANIHVKSYTGHAAQATIDLRGFGGDNSFGKTLILLDGRRLNRPDMAGINWLQIPMGLIDRIEVVRGTQTTLYGDNALGGVINIITKKGTPETHVTASSLYGENTTYNTRVGITGSSDRLFYALNAETTGSNGWRDRTAYQSDGAGVRLGYDCSDSVSVSGGLSYSKLEFEMPGNLTKAEMAESRRQYQPARSWWEPTWFWTATSPAHDADEGHNEYLNSDFLVEASLGNFGEAEMNFTYGTKDVDSDIPSGWAPGQYNQLDISTSGVAPKYILERDIYGFGNKIITGFDLYWETLILDQYLDPERTQHAWHAKSQKDTIAWYLRDEFSPLENIILGFGYRWEEVEFSTGKEERPSATAGTGTAYATKSKKHQENVFGIDTTWLISDNARVYAKFDQLFRYPFIDEHASFYGWADGFNPNLKPETGYTYEIGGDISPRNGLKIELAYFLTNLEDEITWDNTLNQNINLDKTEHQGIEASLTYKFADLLSFYASYCRHWATFRDGAFKDKELPFVPHHHLTAGLDFKLPYDFHVCPEILYVSEQYLGNDFDNSSEKIDAYTVCDLYVKYKPDPWRNIKMTAFIGANNIFDEEYETWGFERTVGTAPANTYFPANTRQFLGGITVEF